MSYPAQPYCTCPTNWNSILPPPPCRCFDRWYDYGGTTVGPTPAWECPRCRVINAPGTQACACAPQHEGTAQIPASEDDLRAVYKAALAMLAADEREDADPAAGYDVGHAVDAGKARRVLLKVTKAVRAKER